MHNLQNSHTTTVCILHSLAFQQRAFRLPSAADCSHSAIIGPPLTELQEICVYNTAWNPPDCSKGSKLCKTEIWCAVIQFMSGCSVQESALWNFTRSYLFIASADIFVYTVKLPLSADWTLLCYAATLLEYFVESPILFSVANRTTMTTWSFKQPIRARDSIGYRNQNHEINYLVIVQTPKMSISLA